jgi:hypothetical protein
MSSQDEASPEARTPEDGEIEYDALDYSIAVDLDAIDDLTINAAGRDRIIADIAQDGTLSRRQILAGAGGAGLLVASPIPLTLPRPQKQAVS